MIAAGRRKIHTIPAGLPFAKSLAAHIWAEHHETPETLPQTRILLPTRRACRTVREAFLSITGGAPLLLPQLLPLGDVEEDALALQDAGQGKAALELPPALPPLRRQLLLARLIHGLKDLDYSFEQALQLAQPLGHLMDQIYTEGLSFTALEKLVPEQFAAHWQITLRFLEILSLHWPRVLEEEGAIDAADRRERLIRAQAAQWRAAPPQTPVIAAGSTGSIPATAELLDVIAGLPQGCVVLPGLDTAMDEASWNSLTESHPQYGFRHLLTHLQTTREQVTLWPGTESAPHSTRMKARRLLAREMMRPAATTEAWTDLRTQQKFLESLPQALQGLEIALCKNEQEEAQIVALALRQTLETPGRTAAFITPDRGLAQRVTAACRRWGITVDDSGGKPLDHTPHGHFLLQIADVCALQLAPLSLLALLKHPLCRPWPDHRAYRQAVEELEQALRGPKPMPGLAGLRARLADAAARHRDITQAARLLETLESLTTPLLSAAAARQTRTLPDWVQDHLRLAEALAGAALWRGEDGEAAALFLAGLLEQGRNMPETAFQDYRSILQHLLRGVTIRPAYGTHPRLQILGQLEARLVDADLVILGGLNEAVWPPEPGHDPWMSRPMRGDFGLPAAARAIGLSAHDFVQGFCHADVLLTAAERRSGTPAAPARWLQRLETVLQAAGAEDRLQPAVALLTLARALDTPDHVQPAARPAPKPDIKHRPRMLSVTEVETWLQDPYGVYARAVLGLKALKPLEQEPDAAQRGTFLHDVFERFLRTCPDDLPADAETILLRIGEERFRALHDDPAVWRFWWPRFERIAAGFVTLERARRQTLKPLLMEGKGAYVFPSALGPFTLTARADRIDRRGDHGFLIDYKSGGNFTRSGLATGQYPQLPLEAVILQHGGFADAGRLTPAGLSYWIMTGGAKPIQTVDIADDVPTLAARTEESLRQLIAVYADEATPYHSLPRGDKKPRFSDYTHLARVGEWSVIGTDDAAAESEAA